VEVFGILWAWRRSQGVVKGELEHTIRGAFIGIQTHMIRKGAAGVILVYDPFTYFLVVIKF
jgi:hypothetical protein